MADVTIDKVQIEIEAKSSNADKGLENLEKSLDRVKRALGGFDTSALDALGNKIKKVSDALDALNKKQSPKNINISPSVDTSELGKAEKQIEKSLDSIRDKFTRMSVLANAAIGGDSSSITSYQRQAISLQGDIDVLLSKFEQFKDVKVQSDEFLKLDNQIEDLNVKLQGLLAKEKEATSGTSMDNDSFIKLQNEIGSTQTKIDELIAKQQEMVKDGSYMVNPFEKYMTALDILRDKFRTTSQEVQDAKTKMEEPPTPNTDPANSKLNKLGNTAKSVGSKIMSLGSSGLKSAVEGLKGSFDKVKKGAEAVGKGVDKLGGHFNKGFMQVLKYGFGIRSLYVGFRRLRKVVINAFEGLQSSGAFFATTKANVEGLKSSISTLGAQFGAAFEPIFNAVAPALQTLINYLISAMNVFSAFTAKLMGKDTYSKAVTSTSSVAKNVGGAAKSAKELNKQLAGFDELNNLSSNDNAGGSGGSGGSSGSSGVQFTTENVDSVLGDFGKDLAKKIKEGDWEGVGTAISEELTKSLKKIPWDKIYDTCSDFGSGLAKFLRGLITPELFGEIGTAVGNSLKAVLTTTKAFAEEMNKINKDGKTGWEQFGESIAAAINGFVKSNPLKLLVENFNEWAKGILSTLCEAVEDIGWEDIGDSIADAIGAIDSWTIGWELGTLVDDLVQGIYKIVSNKDTWTNIGEKIADGINGFSDAIEGEDFAETCNAIADGIWEMLGVALANISWEELGDDIATFIGDLDIGTISLIAAVALAPAAAAAIKTAFPKLISAPITSLGGVSVGTVAVSCVAALAIGWKIGNKLYEWATGEEVEGGMADQLKEVFSGLFGKDKIDFDLGDFLTYTFDGDSYWNGFWGDVGEKVYYGVDNIKTKIKTVGGEVIQAFKDGVEIAVNGIALFIDTTFVQPVKSALNFAQSIVEKGKQIVTDMKNGIIDGMKSISEWVTTNIVEPIKSAVKSKWDSVFGTIKNISLNISAITDKAFETVKSTVQGWRDKAADITTNLKGKAADKIKDIQEKLKNLKSKYGKLTLKSTLTDGVSKVVKTIKDKIKTIKASLSVKAEMTGKLYDKITAVKNIYDTIKGKAIAISTTFQDSFTSAIKKAWNGIANGINKAVDVINKIPGVSISKVPTLATGGVATRATNAIFGEAGAEAVVPLENNLGWLKKMSNLMLDGLADASKYQQVSTPQSLGFDTYVNSPNGAISNNNSSELIAEQNRLLAEQNRLLQQIANKDVTISSRDVFNATWREAQNYNDRTGNSPFLF